MEKIILFTDAWHPQVNGVVKCVQEAKKFLEKNGFNVTVVHPGLFYSIPVFFYPEITMSIFCYGKVKKILKTEKPDYIHIFTEGSIGLAARSLCLKNNLKFTTSHHTNFQYYIQYYLHLNIKFLFTSIYSYLRWFHNASSKTMVITESLKRELEKHGFLHVFLWPLGVDLELFKRNLDPELKNTYTFSKPIFVYFGRIAKEKNVEEFLALNLPGTKLVIGDGPLKKSLENKYGKNAVFVGYKKGKELVDLLSVCDVFVFPSMTDVFPLAIIEAFACSLPVAAHDVMDLKDLVTKEVGVLDKNLEIAAVKCLNVSREKCRDYAMHFSWENSADYFIKNLVKNNY